MRAAFFDIDGTLTSERTWKGMLRYFQQRGLRRATRLAFLGTHYPLYFLRRMKLISESAFRSPWAAHLAWYVRGYTPQQAQEIWDWSITQFLGHYWRADSRALLDQHRQDGDLVVLVSAAPQPLVERIASEVGAQHAIGTRFATRDGRYTGGTLPPVAIDANKALAVQNYLASQSLEIELSDSFAYADSISDLPLLEMVGHPVAVYADEALRALAVQRGWRIFPE